MNQEQVEALIELIELESEVAARRAVHQPAAKFQLERLEELKKELRESVEG